MVDTHVAFAFRRAPHLIWWALLEERVLEARHVLPKSLKGRIRFRIERADFTFIDLAIDIAGVNTTLGASRAPGDVEVETSDLVLHALLTEAVPPHDVFRITG